MCHYFKKASFSYFAVSMHLNPQIICKKPFCKLRHHLQTRESNKRGAVFPTTFFSLSCSPPPCISSLCPFPGRPCSSFPSLMPQLPLLPLLLGFCQLHLFSGACEDPRSTNGGKTSLSAFPWGMLWTFPVRLQNPVDEQIAQAVEAGSWLQVLSQNSVWFGLIYV